MCQYSDAYILVPEYAIFMKLTSLDRSQELMLILYIANCCYCSQGLCTGIEKLTVQKVSMIGQIDRSSDGNKYTHIETCQLLDTTCTYRAISYLSDFQVLA